MDRAEHGLGFGSTAAMGVGEDNDGIIAQARWREFELLIGSPARAGDG